MIRRLVEAHYFQHRDRPTEAQVRFWLRELRTPELLVETARNHQAAWRRAVSRRALLACAIDAEMAKLQEGLRAEELGERERDRHYWLPLRAELERLRHDRLEHGGEI